MWLVLKARNEEICSCDPLDPYPGVRHCTNKQGPVMQK